MKGNIIVEFTKFQKPQTTWNVYLTSTVENKDGLSKDVINEALNSLKNSSYIEWIQKSNQETKDKNRGNIGEWQIDKSEEIGNSFANSLKVKFIDNKVSVVVDFDVIVPSDWDKRDIIGWVQGFHRIMKAHLFITQKEIINFGESFDRKKNDEIYKFLTDIIRHEKFDLDHGVF